MKCELHTAIAVEVAKRLGWPDPEAIGRGAAMPDAVEIVEVEGIGTRFLGMNISCLTHFAGYNLGMDRSLGKIELPDRDIRYRAGVWPEIPLGMEPREPLCALLLVPGYTHAFDEITWPSAWSYSRFFHDCYLEASKSRRDPTPSTRYARLGFILGMELHYIGDIMVPEHRRNELGASHAAFEDQQLQRWKGWDPSDREKMIVEQIDRAAPWCSHDIIRAAAAQKTPRQSWWACRRRKAVDASIRDTVRCCASVLKHTPMQTW